MYSENFRLYKEKVVAAFLEKSAQANASWLVDLNRRKIRDYCVERIERGVEPDDHRAISDYLKMKAGDREYLTAVNATDADYFQALYQFLKEPSRNPASAIVELVSWLVDFQDRPFAKYLANQHTQPVEAKEDVIRDQENERQSDHAGKEEQETVISTRSGIPTNEVNIRPLVSNTSGTGVQGDKPKSVITRQWYIGIAMILLLGVIYWRYTHINECMYWDNYHYVATSCNVPRPDTPLIALDEARLKHFTRIERIDTITKNSVGKLWWVSIDGQIEIYTSGGTHPLYPNKTLKKVTDYVVNVLDNRKSKK
ncbi:hypothetical protein [Mucilaginibacter terrae]|uniref:Uncharacterized protein n=1 Tax=Mucilaginibacter terrae TaxID=1955052 RepID=A0ABU3GR44_9SPHI|nr:hypothetical protein [Mucilaginibacter terrae]MDT3402253.1 hypothetical protein [Mucilaginibacter terrae]